MRHVINSTDLSPCEIGELIEVSHKIIKDPSKFSNACRGKILATLFYEPSTRTRLSFESAMYGLGGNVLGFSSADSSSAAKGESVADTIRMVSSYADICALRHFKEGAPLVASQYSKIPVINAGDGGRQHPTQTFTDLLTIHSNKERLDHLVIGFCGDLKFGRTVHSLISAMSKYEGNRFILVSPPELRVPAYIIEESLKKHNIEFMETANLEETIGMMDILYVTRVQRERFFNEEDYIRLRDSFIITRDKLRSARDDLSILHPLPRVNEIAVEVDADNRAKYFEQAMYGRYVRMALILKLLEWRQSGAEH